MDIIEGAGYFIYPLGLCSVVAVYIIVERYLALRSARVVPLRMLKELGQPGFRPSAVAGNSALGRVICFARDQQPDAEGVKAYAELEVARLERGLFGLEIVIGAAPLLGLLGTVTGLVSVFANISPETGMPDTQSFTQGVALALTTTMLGLMIAIPAIIGNSYLNRRVDILAAQLNMAVERVMGMLVNSD